MKATHRSGRIYDAYLLWREILSNSVKVPQDFVNEGIRFSRLLHHKVPSALLGNLDKRITSHILHTYEQGRYQHDFLS